MVRIQDLFGDSLRKFKSDLCETNSPKKQINFNTSISSDFLKSYNQKSSIKQPSKFIGSLKSSTKSVEFYNNKSSKSFKDHEIKFTNFIHTVRDPHILIALDRLKREGLKVILNDNFTTIDEITEKMRICIHNVVDEDIERLSDSLIKFNYSGALENKESIRIYCYYEQEFFADKDAEYTIKIILVDPYHLIIPTPFNGMTREKAENHNYYSRANYRICISEQL